MDRRIQSPPVTHQTGIEILKRHAFILHETVAIHHAGMTDSAKDLIAQEIDKIERMIKDKEKTK